jgi:hypothetical protein
MGSPAAAGALFAKEQTARSTGKNRQHAEIIDVGQKHDLLVEYLVDHLVDALE